MTQNRLFRSTTLALLLGATALPVMAQNEALVVEMPQQPNASTVVAPPAGGFAIRVNGETLTADRSVTNIARRVDVALEQADVQVVFDGLGGKPRLDFEAVDAPASYAPGDRMVLQSELNYPAYVARAEMRVIDRAALGGPQTVLVAPVAPNGQTALTVPEGRDLIVVHRVYDSDGRFDETTALPLADPASRPRAADVEDGTDATARRGIPVYGGAVTVRGSGVTSGARVAVMGETVQPDGSGGFVLQRILPAGDYDVAVAVNGAGQNVNQTRRVEIPASEWFYTGTVDLTYGRREVEGEQPTTYQTGRVAGYADGRTENGVEITASVDTGEGDLDEIFRDFDEKDPRQLLLRVDPDDLYPTYGDDSTLEDNTPTSGKLYVRIAREGNFVQWGDFKSTLAGNTYVRNERTLYGLQGHAETRAATSRGEARARLDLYAAQPEKLPHRDTFLGTGGSVYFLEKQDISAASETITLQLRDRNTSRVIETRTLVAGTDYEINYIQGIVTLSRPLSSSLGQSTVVTDPTAAADLQLNVQYEYTPTASDLDGFSYGGRAEAWATDQLRFGVSGIKEQTGLADQTLVGADILFQSSETAFVQFDYAQSDGVGFGSTFSADGGLIVGTTDPTAGTGEALKVSGRVGFADLGLAGEGAFTAYFEDRTEGFSSLETSVTAATGDETLWGLALEAQPSERLRYAFYYDDYENTVGEFDRTGGAEIGVQLSEPLLLDLGVEHVDRNRGANTGSRTDVAAKLTYAISDRASVYGFAQNTVDVEGLDSNDRVGLGGAYAFENGWSVEGEVSDGDLGQGARLLAAYDDDAGNRIYFGYDLEPGRALNGVTLNGRDKGRFVTGGKRQVNSALSYFGENTYDAFGSHRSLTSAYGFNYVANDTWRYTAALEFGTIDNADDTDFERQAVSFGATYEDEALIAEGRVEYRTEDGLRSGTDLDSDTLLIAADARYKISENARIVGSLDYAKTDTDESAILNGTYTDVVLGYAYRPVDHDRLNVLARYRYLADLYGQQVDGTDEDGPVQRSHVVSVDAIYDLNAQWSIGGKLGYRASETAGSAADAFAQNDAWLAVGALTYHSVHQWDALLEVRSLNTVQGATQDTGFVATAYRHLGNNVKLGIGYNFGRFSDDLTDLVQDDQGAFVNLVAKF